MNHIIGTTQSQCIHADMSNDVAAEEEMIRGGQMEVLIEDANH